LWKSLQNLGFATLGAVEKRVDKNHENIHERILLFTEIKAWRGCAAGNGGIAGLLDFVRSFACQPQYVVS
jgi:hypothetical protein